MTRHRQARQPRRRPDRIRCHAARRARRLRPAARPRRRARRPAPRRRARRRPHRHVAVLRTRRRQRAHPRGSAPLPRRPAPRDEGRRAPRRRRAAGCPRCVPTSCAPASRTTSARSTSSSWTLVNLRLLDDEPGTGGYPPLAEMLGALDDLRREGKLELIGLSNVTRARSTRHSSSSRSPACRTSTRCSTAPTRTCWRPAASAGWPSCPSSRSGSAFTGGPQRLAEDATIARRGRQARRDALAGRPRLAAASRRAHPAHPRNLIGAHLEENLAAADVALDGDDMTRSTPSSRPATRWRRYTTEQCPRPGRFRRGPGGTPRAAG